MRDSEEVIYKLVIDGIYVFHFFFQYYFKFHSIWTLEDAKSADSSWLGRTLPRIVCVVFIQAANPDPGVH